MVTPAGGVPPRARAPIKPATSQHLRGLNPQQADAVQTIHGPLLVLAGAGTGKTRVVTSRMAEILARGAPPTQICAVTFTNKAAKEMRERLGKMLGADRCEGLIASTFHSLGVRILREDGTRIGIPRGFSITDRNDQVEVLTDALRELGVGRDLIRPADAVNIVSGWKNAGVMPDEAIGRARDNREEKVAHAFGAYEEGLARRGLLDFDDLILKPMLLLSQHGDLAAKLRERWKYLLVDEYQDTNATQYRLLRLLCGTNPNLCVVGDDDQSIYGWRGAEPDRILTFARDFPGAKIVTLEQNYRSTMHILRAANRVIGGNSARRDKKLWSALGDGEVIDLYLATDEKDETDRVAMTVGRLLRQGVKHQEVAVLFRANRQCRPLEQAFRSRQIPYRVVGTRSFFDRREVRDLLAYLRVAQNRSDDVALLRIINHPPRGIGKASIDLLKRRAGELRMSMCTAAARVLDELPAKARAGTEDLLSRLETIVATAAASGVAAAISQLVDAIQYRDILRMDTPDAAELQVRLNAVDDVVALAQDYQSRGGRGGLEAFLESLALREDDRREDDQDKPQVWLLTVHAAKGLEFPHVFLVGVEEGIIPHKNSIGGDPDDEDAPLDDSKGIEEERRLFYVAMTRARRKLQLSYVRKRIRYGREEACRPSRFLDEMGTEGVSVVDALSDEPASRDEMMLMKDDFLARLKKGAPPP